MQEDDRGEEARLKSALMQGHTASSRPYHDKNKSDQGRGVWDVVFMADKLLDQ